MCRVSRDESSAFESSTKRTWPAPHEIIRSIVTINILTKIIKMIIIIIMLLSSVVSRPSCP